MGSNPQPVGFTVTPRAVAPRLAFIILTLYIRELKKIVKLNEIFQRYFPILDKDSAKYLILSNRH